MVRFYSSFSFGFGVVEVSTLTSFSTFTSKPPFFGLAGLLAFAPSVAGLLSPSVFGFGGAGARSGFGRALMVTSPYF